jgi:hypothetical protein
MMRFMNTRAYQSKRDAVGTSKIPRKRLPGSLAVGEVIAPLTGQSIL